MLGSVIRETPLLESSALSALVGGQVFLKCENLQRGGSFKVRGAYVRIARLSEAERARGVVAASAGNHAQGVALAAAALGTRATVVMPAAAPLPKVAATRSYGADVVLHGAAVEDALAMARDLAEETGSIFIHPFDHPDVIAGQGTIGLEIAEQCPEVETIVVPVGGGGIAAGIAAAATGVRPGVQVLGVQAEAVAPMPASIAAGHPVSVTPTATMADGIAVARPGDLPVALLAGLGVRVVTVSEENLSRGLLLCLERAKQVVEPAGAAGVAALLEHLALVTAPVVIVLSGGNIDPLLLSKVLRHGLSAAGRFLAFRCKLPDRPGALATLLMELAALGANVLDVVHERVTADLHVDEAEVNLHLETRGPEHTDSVISQLRKSGYTVLFD
jgi:threonine dehydratase